MREKLERWQELCTLAAKEQDADKLMVLIKEINELLSEKERRLQKQQRRSNDST